MNDFGHKYKYKGERKIRKNTFGIIVGKRSFFPGKLIRQGYKDIAQTLQKHGYDSVVLSESQTEYGAVESIGDVEKCVELFQSRADDIDGIIVTLPNFGDEKSIAEVIRRAHLNVPILVHAEPDSPNKMTLAERRDSFCGKFSICNNLYQIAVPFTLTSSHTVKVKSVEFKKDLDFFAAVCRIVRGLRNVRFGAIGTRPAPFNTVRYSEKILQRYGISVDTIDLSEIIGRASKLEDGDKRVKNKLATIKNYTNTDAVPAEALTKMAKLGSVIDEWVAENKLNGTAIQCWTSLEQFYGITPCTLMSMMSDNLIPTACEVDITGLLGMYILQLASGTASAILDWNNNCGDSKDECLLFHCSNIPKTMLKSSHMYHHEIIAGTVGRENAFGVVKGRIKASPMTFCKTTTEDTKGIVKAYVGEGKFTNNKPDTYGGYGIAKVANLQSLLKFVCLNGFEHHVALNLSQTADAVAEALGTYMGWDVYRHR